VVIDGWASASTYRGLIMRGGAHGARLPVLRHKSDWEVNQPEAVGECFEFHLTDQKG